LVSFTVTVVKSYARILAAFLALAALGPSAFGSPNIICIESSGRVSYGCKDLIPDELAARLGIPAQFGMFAQDCGFCHDYVVGQATTNSSDCVAVPTHTPDCHLPALVEDNFITSDLSFPVSIIDSSGNLPLKY